MHFVGMIACGLDVRITFNIPLTGFSAFVAVIFTFAAFSSAYISDAVENSRMVLVWCRAWRELRSRVFSCSRNPRGGDVEAGGYMPISSTSDAGDETLTEVRSQGSRISVEDDESEVDDTIARPQVPTRSRTPSFSGVQLHNPPPDLPTAEASTSTPISFPPLPQQMARNPTRLCPSIPSPRGTPSPNNGSLDSLSNTDSGSEQIFASHSRPNSQGSHSNSLSSTITTSSNTYEPLHAGLSREARMRIKAQATDRPLPKFGWRYWVRQHYKAISFLMFIRASVWALAIVFMHYSGECRTPCSRFKCSHR